MLRFNTAFLLKSTAITALGCLPMALDRESAFVWAAFFLPISLAWLAYMYTSERVVPDMEVAARRIAKLVGLPYEGYRALTEHLRPYRHGNKIKRALVAAIIAICAIGRTASGMSFTDSEFPDADWQLVQIRIPA